MTDRPPLPPYLPFSKNRKYIDRTHNQSRHKRTGYVKDEFWNSFNCFSYCHLEIQYFFKPSLMRKNELRRSIVYKKQAQVHTRCINILHVAATPYSSLSSGMRDDVAQRELELNFIIWEVSGY